MDDATRKYAASRDYRGKAFRSGCYAPFVSLELNPDGVVKVCCYNAAHPVGRIPDQTLTEIWNGGPIRELRDALTRFDFDRGCDFCKWEIRENNHAHAFARNYDIYEVPAPDVTHPQFIDFALSNACNLECVQCDAYYSSAIQRRRGGALRRAPVYTEAFFAELREYLPWLVSASFTGGEPFLGAENYRIWDLIIEDRLGVGCHVTTNGTVYNAKVERVLERVRCSLSLSLDGCTKETLERTRVNARFDVVMANFRRFHAYSASQGFALRLNFCLMRQNWHEFGEFLLFAEAQDCPVIVNPVVAPGECSLFTLPAGELRAVVERLEDQADRVLPQLHLNRERWLGEVARLRNRLECQADAGSGEPAPGLLELGKLW